MIKTGRNGVEYLVCDTCGCELDGNGDCFNFCEEDPNSERERYLAGWMAADHYIKVGMDITTHGSQDDSVWSQGWNARIDKEANH